ncbi:hypothetical protein Tco_0754576 [Tanacetum coccineum]
MVRGDWIPNGTKLFIISIYAPQDLSEKKMLWDYLSHVIAQWAGEFPKGSNSSFIALIPKTCDANMVKDFRPISLIGSMYKIIAKILANRLVLVLGDLVNEVQSAFIADRQILDGSFILNEIVSSQHVKSKLMGIYVDADKVAQAARKIGCVTLKTPFTYLGSKVGGHMSRIQSWNETIEAMASRLSKWKMKTLSIGVWNPLFNFFNGSDPHAKKPTWVKWRNVLASKDKGGLGISSLYALNRALMFKWVWRFLSQNSSLWANVIKSIHGDHGKIDKQVKVSYPSIWLDIVKEVDLLKKRYLKKAWLSLSVVKPRGGGGLDQFDSLEGDGGRYFFVNIGINGFGPCKSSEISRCLN